MIEAALVSQPFRLFRRFDRSEAAGEALGRLLPGGFGVKPPGDGPDPSPCPPRAVDFFLGEAPVTSASLAGPVTAREGSREELLLRGPLAVPGC
jgi:hypothetical protein